MVAARYVIAKAYPSREQRDEAPLNDAAGAASQTSGRIQDPGELQRYFASQPGYWFNFWLYENGECCGYTCNLKHTRYFLTGVVWVVVWTYDELSQAFNVLTNSVKGTPNGESQDLFTVGALCGYISSLGDAPTGFSSNAVFVLHDGIHVHLTNSFALAQAFLNGEYSPSQLDR